LPDRNAEINIFNENGEWKVNIKHTMTRTELVGVLFKVAQFLTFDTQQRLPNEIKERAIVPLQIEPIESQYPTYGSSIEEPEKQQPTDRPYYPTFPQVPDHKKHTYNKPETDYRKEPLVIDDRIDQKNVALSPKPKLPKANGRIKTIQPKSKTKADDIQLVTIKRPKRVIEELR